MSIGYPCFDMTSMIQYGFDANSFKIFFYKNPLKLYTETTVVCMYMY